jgi:hypothetical protein
MKRHLSAVLLAVVSLLPSLAQTPKQFDAKQILDQSYALSSKLDTNERLFYLVRLTDISTSISPDKTPRWCEELFDLASASELSWNRVAHQKNALVPLSRVNPQLALQRLGTVDVPQIGDNGYSEDVRADAAVEIFANNWKLRGSRAFSEIRLAAQKIADSKGEYPFRAVGYIVQELAKGPDKQGWANDIFRDALNYYRVGSKFQDEHAEFFDLVWSAQFKISKDLYRPALQLYVDRLLHDDSKDFPSFHGEIHAPNGIVYFSSERAMLLFRVFPLIANLDPTWAEELRTKHPELQQALGPIKAQSASMAPGPSGAEQLSKMQTDARDALFIQRIEDLQQTDPIAALQRVKELKAPNDAILRLAGFSSVLPGMAQLNFAEAKNIYNQMRADSEAFKDSPMRLKSLLALAKAAYYVNNVNDSSDYIAALLDEGQLAFAASTKPVVSRSGYNELRRVTEFAAMHQFLWIVDRILGMQDTTPPAAALKAHLLLYAAKGLAVQEVSRQVVRTPLQASSH